MNWKCFFRYKPTTNTGNLRDHLRDKHGIDLSHKLTDKNQRKVTDMLMTVGKPIPDVDRPMSEKRFILARQMCLWFCRDLLPFNAANKDGFHDFAVYAKMIKENEKLPDRTTLSDAALNDIYSALKVYTKKFVELWLPRTITISMDFWRDNVKRVSYINYWINFRSGSGLFLKLLEPDPT